LREAGYRLGFAREARSTHRWRDSLAGYWLQQYGFGYGRLDVVAKHPRRITGDTVSPVVMMAHPALVLVALLLLIIAGCMAATGASWKPAALTSAALFGALTLDRTV